MDSDEDRLREVFALIDEDAGGHISADEVKKFADALGPW
eukprot:gene6237-4083_t